MKTNGWLLFCSVVALAGCGAEQGTPDPTPPAHGVQLATGSYQVPAGSEKYYCFATTLAEAGTIGIDQVEAFEGASVHHMAVFRTLEPEPEGFAECPVLIKQSWIPIYGNGVAKNNITLDLPAGTAFKIAGNSQLLIQLHLLNASTSDRTEKTFVNLRYVDDPESRVGAGIFAVGTNTIDIPAGTQGYSVSNGCTLERDLDVFAFFPHMHQHGTKIMLEAGATEDDAQPIYQRDPWSFGDQTMDPIQLSLKKGTYVRATCTYDNLGQTPVTYGESSADEMCYMVMFMTPFDHLDGCVSGL